MTAVMGGGIGGGSVGTGALADGSVTLQKLSTAVQNTLAVTPGMVLVQTQTVAGSDATSVSFTGLSAASVKAYILIGYFVNSRGSASSIALYLNADTTNAHYDRQLEETNSTTMTLQNAAYPPILQPGTNEAAWFVLKIIQPNGVQPVGLLDAGFNGTSAMKSYRAVFRKNNATTDITSIQVTDLDGAYLKIGSTFSLYKVV